MAINLYSKASVDSLLSPKLSISSLTNAAATTLNATAPTTGQVLSFDGTQLKWASAGGSASWGFITGTLSSQTDLQNALDLKAPLASPTFTGTVTIPAGASISGYLTNSTLSNGATSTLNATAPTTGQALTYDGTNLKWSTVGGGSWLGNRVSIYAGYLYNEDNSAYVSTLTLQGASTMNAQNFTLQASGGGVLTFADATTQSTAAIGIPTAGATGQVLTKNSGTNYDVAWANAGGADVQVFGSSSTSGSFTWTKPAGAKWVEIYLGGGGGGAGSGARQATATNRCGGGGGAGGTTYQGRINAAYLGSTVTVVVGAGGAGGASVGANSTNGNNGTAGGSTTFSIFKAVGGNLGAGGTTVSPAAGGVSRTSMFMGLTSSAGAGVDGQTSSGADASSYTNGMTATGGGAGAGSVSGGTVSRAGGAGGSFSSVPTSSGFVTSIAGGSGGTTAGVAATNGTSSTTQYTIVGTGGGGGAYISGVAGGAGGNGGWPSGGAGAGAAADNGFASGKGGDGANGIAVIVTYF